MRHTLLALLVALIGSADMSAQKNQWFTPDDNLSSSLINQIHYDSMGLIWVATEHGLNKFDGAKFTTYCHVEGDSTSLASNFINCVYEDDKKRLFVSTHDGLQIYDYTTDRFSVPLREKDGGHIGKSMSDMIKTASGELLVFGDHIYEVVDEGKYTYLQRLDLPEIFRFSGHAALDPRGNIWVSKYNQGMLRICADGSTKQYFGKDSDPEFLSVAMCLDGDIYA